MRQLRHHRPVCNNNDQQYQVLTDTYGPAHTADVDGINQTIRTHTAYTYDAGAPNSDINADGNPYMLVTTSKTDSASLGDGPSRAPPPPTPAPPPTPTATTTATAGRSASP